MTTGIKLVADNINGVAYGDFDENNYDVLGDEDFIQALATCQDCEILYGVVNLEVFNNIKVEYGVRV